MIHIPPRQPDDPICASGLSEGSISWYRKTAQIWQNQIVKELENNSKLFGKVFHED